MMNKQEFARLMGYWHAKKLDREHSSHKPSKCHSKAIGSATGQILKDSRVYSTDRVFLMECN